MLLRHPFAFSAVWVGIAFTIAKSVPPLTALMLVGYPWWDAVANYVDAGRSGGLRRNKSHAECLVSVVTAIAGLFQLFTAAGRRTSYGAQWAMILSAAQSVLAGGLMLKVAGGNEPVGIANIAPYPALGAFYFLVFAIWLTVSDARRNSKAAVT